MSTNDPLKSVEKVVQLPTGRRSGPMPALQVPRPQPMLPVLFESWAAVRDRAAASLLGGNRRLLLVGPAGTGKTVLIEHVARVLRAAGRTVMIQLADADPAPPGPGETLFVDEADRLSPAKLRRLFDEAAGTVVLAGLAPLVDRVASGTARLTLDPLDRTGARDYIAQWLTLHGRTPAELDSKAVHALAELSGGIPRLLSTLLAAGSWLANGTGARVIEASHIHEAAELRSVLGPPSQPASAVAARTPAWRPGVPWSALLTGVVLAGIATAIVPRLFPAETAQALERVSPLVEQAGRWLRAGPSSPPRRPATIAVPPPVDAAPPPAPIAPVEPPQAAQPAAAPEPAIPLRELPPEPAPEPVQAATPVAPVVVAPSSTLPAEMVEFLLRRGREMLALDDLSAARLLFLRAAEGGSAEAMFAVGQTYDPAVHASLAAGQSDREEALRWYRRAAANGNPAAGRLLPKPADPALGLR